MILFVLFFIMLKCGDVYVGYYSDENCSENNWIYSSIRGTEFQNCTPKTFFQSVQRYVKSNCVDGELVTNIYSDEKCLDFLRNEKVPYYPKCVRNVYDDSTYIKGTCDYQPRKDAVQIQVMVSLNPLSPCDPKFLMMGTALELAQNQCTPFPFEQYDLGWKDVASIKAACKDGKLVGEAYSDKDCGVNFDTFEMKPSGECTVLVPNVTVSGRAFCRN